MLSLEDMMRLFLKYIDVDIDDIDMFAFTWL